MFKNKASTLKVIGNSNQLIKYLLFENFSFKLSVLALKYDIVAFNIIGVRCECPLSFPVRFFMRIGFVVTIRSAMGI